jgi:hypothetical protein
VPDVQPKNMIAMTLTADSMSAHRQVKSRSSTHNTGRQHPRRVQFDARELHGFGQPESRMAIGARSPSVELAGVCAREVAVAERQEGFAMLFVAACALSLLAGAALYIERSIAHWDSFESFVRAVLG